MNLFSNDTLLEEIHFLKNEIITAKRVGKAAWLKSQRNGFYSQFMGETRKAPDDRLLKSIGYLIWCSSLYEIKLSRANFWLNCYIQNKIVELPGQHQRRTALIKSLKSQLGNARLDNLLGDELKNFIVDAINFAEKSISFRDDIVHGHHMGAWSEGIIFRAKGKKFEREKSYELKVSSRKITLHSNRMLYAAAVLSLLDNLFDMTLNG